jgi:hypothetical protein
MMRATVARTGRSRLGLRLGGCLLVACSVLFLAAPAARAECPLTDPSCAADAATEAAAQAVDDAANAATDAVQDVADQVQKEADEAVVEVTDCANQVVSAVGTLLPGEGGGTGAPQPSDPPGPGAPSGGGGGHGGDSTRESGPEGAPSASGPLAFSVATRRQATFVDVPAMRLAIPQGRDGGRGIAEAARRAVFPLLLVLMVIAFVVVQHRLDRSDPKLALAPVAPDVLRFT